MDILVKKDVNNIGNDFQEIENIIPRTLKEFIVFYELTYPDINKSTEFYKINELILKYSKEDKGDLFFLLLNMAEFVDGEYAEGYFYDIEDIIVKNKVKFCVIYKYLSKESKRRIEDIYLEVCKGIERPEEDDY